MQCSAEIISPLMYDLTRCYPWLTLCGSHERQRQQRRLRRWVQQTFPHFLHCSPSNISHVVLHNLSPRPLDRSCRRLAAPCAACAIWKGHGAALSSKGAALPIATQFISLSEL